MISKNHLKHLASLKQAKFRKEHQEFIVEGEKMVAELLKSPFRIKSVYGVVEWMQENASKFAKISTEEITQKDLERISSLKTPNKVLALVEIPIQQEIKNPSKGLHLILDTIQDPGNLGSIIRTADWFGIENIYCSKDTVSFYNPKVIQSTMGSFARVKVFYTELVKLLEQNIDLQVFGSLLDGENIFKKKLDQNAFLIIGNESKGISKEVQAFIDQKVMIPSFAINESDQAESLNAALATAILCAEFRKQSN